MDVDLLYCVLPFFRLLFIDTDFQMLRLKAEDSSGRQHILAVKLKSKVRLIASCIDRNTRTYTYRCKDWMDENYASSNGILYSLMLTHNQSESKQANFPKRIWVVQFADSKSVIYICALKSRSNWRGCGET